MLSWCKSKAPRDQPLLTRHFYWMEMILKTANSPWFLCLANIHRCLPLTRRRKKKSGPNFLLKITGKRIYALYVIKIKLTKTSVLYNIVLNEDEVSCMRNGRFLLYLVASTKKLTHLGKAGERRWWLQDRVLKLLWCFQVWLLEDETGMKKAG